MYENVEIVIWISRYLLLGSFKTTIRFTIPSKMNLFLFEQNKF